MLQYGAGPWGSWWGSRRALLKPPVGLCVSTGKVQVYALRRSSSQHPWGLCSAWRVPMQTFAGEVVSVPRLWPQGPRFPLSCSWGFRGWPCSTWGPWGTEAPFPWSEGAAQGGHIQGTARRSRRAASRLLGCGNGVTCGLGHTSGTVHWPETGHRCWQKDPVLLFPALTPVSAESPEKKGFFH